MLHPTLRLFSLPLALLVTGGAAQATAPALPLAEEVAVDGVAAYDDAVPKPEEVLGHVIGTRHTRADQIARYFEAVAAASDRVVVREHARTYQGRPLVHAIVTSPANHRRLDEIRRANLRLSDAPGEVGDAELEGMPAILYLGYSVHGNEASGSEAAILALYHLAAGRGPAVEAVLEGTVVVLDPLLNPDGRERFVSWVNDNRGRVPTSDPQDREHSEPWPGGRTNHYLFDLNRDWLPAVHPESRGRLELFHHWRPQLLTDVHEMGGDDTYFFQPGVPTRTHPHIRPETRALLERIGEYHARRLDAVGELYYTRERFDDFYFGKGSTYPMVHGTVGILFEQASSRSLLAETRHGELTYAHTVRNQLLTTLSTLEAAVELRTELLRNQRDFYRDAATFARRAPVEGFVVALDERRTRAQELLATLQRHRVQIHELARPFSAGDRTFQPGRAVVVPVDQPQARFVLGALERRTEFEDTVFYDVSTWTLPLAYGVDYSEVRDGVRRLLGATIGPVEPDGGEVVGGEAAYAYLLDWSRFHAPRALARLLVAGVRTLVLTEPFTAEVAGAPRPFPAGTVVMPLAQRDAAATVTPDDIHALVRRAAREDHVVFYAVDSGLTPQGPDLGSTHALVLDEPRVAVLTGRGSSQYTVGQVWHLLNERMGLPVSLLDKGRVETADLGRYGTIVLADTREGLAEPAVGRLADWVRGGGTLIAIGAAVRWAVENELVEASLRPEPELPGDVPFGELRERRGGQVIGGVIVEADLDTTHPLAFGARRRTALFRDDRIALEPSDRPGVDVATYTDRLLLSGYVSPENRELLRGTTPIQAHRVGEGRIVLFADNPTFRGFWHGTSGLLLNAVFFGRAF